jgi:tRNA (guanine37-N1)-methyltransferase
MRLDIITIFPAVFHGPFAESIIKRAQEQGLVRIYLINLRQFTSDKHQTVDDRP